MALASENKMTLHLINLLKERIGGQLAISGVHPGATAQAFIQQRLPQGHRHRLRTIRFPQYRDAATLLADFWTTVDAVLRERGVIP